ncbi:MAG: hypothetical protein U1C33_07800, partial [Candidatus Cloacimonadaceae bacterium]|nr:hypothetical protein [Candidatus Cloacimonadaceae bacterium]
QIEDIENFYKKAQQPYQYSMIVLGLSFVVWAYNIFDVIQSTEEYNAGVWERIHRDYYEKPLIIRPDGFELRF